MKRAFDCTAALFGLGLLLPVFAAVAMAILMDSRGPILFKQVRVGRGFRRFSIYKFRTMVKDAEGRGPLITCGADPRITRVGAVLRRTKLDELPQLLNVLKGDMSLVGPRPEVPKYVELFADDYRDILRVRPGITDLASLKYRDEAAVLARSAKPDEEYVQRILPEKIKLAREYLDRSSLTFDMRLIVRTVLGIVTGPGRA